jgi:hypothetical protein
MGEGSVLCMRELQRIGKAVVLHTITTYYFYGKGTLFKRLMYSTVVGVTNHFDFIRKSAKNLQSEYHIA